MLVSEIVENMRETANALTSVSRILTRLKPLILSTGTNTAWDRDNQISFFCQSVEAVQKFGAALHAKIELKYPGASARLQAVYLCHGIEFRFTVETTRKVRLEDCTLERKRKSSSGWRTAILRFNGMELASLRYTGQSATEPTKKALWQIALQNQKKWRFEHYEFVL